jgi:phosphoenolpyruvate-protein kinase (PTS system EI component)
VVRQIQVFLSGEPPAETLAAADISGRVIVASDLTPADAILLRHRGVRAFVTEHGGPMSHTAILARSLDIPTVMGVHNATTYLRHDELLVVNAETGTVLAEADAAILAHYRARLGQRRRPPGAAAAGATSPRPVATARRWCCWPTWICPRTCRRARTAPLASACIAPSSCT